MKKYKKISLFSIVALIVAVSFLSCDKRNENPDVKNPEEVSAEYRGKWQAETLTYDSETEEGGLKEVTVP